MPCSRRYVPAGESGRIDPAGEMWAVVTESPSRTSTCAPWMSSTAAGPRVVLSKYGGLARHPVEVRRQPHVRRVGIPREDFPRGCVEPTPAIVAGVDARVCAREH